MRFLGALAAVAVMLVGAGDAGSQESRGVTVTVRTSERADAPVSEKVTLYGSSHALVIGIDDYTQGWPRLRNAVADARSVAGALEERGFDVTLKTDLKAVELQRTLKEFFAIKGADADARLVLWYAGHGHTIGGEGFLVPADAPPATDPTFKVAALPMRDFGSLVRLADARHVLSIFDSCFSGTVFNARAGAAPAAITRKTTQPVRQFLTSGDAGQQVRDDGSFRKLFVRALSGEEAADVNADGYVTGEELGLFLSQRVATLTQAAQTPRYGKLHDVRFDRGDFVFVLPGMDESPAVAGDTPAPTAPDDDAAFELTFWNSIKNSKDPADYQAYLETYPKGKFAALARVRAKRKHQRQAVVVAPRSEAVGERLPTRRGTARQVRDAVVAALEDFAKAHPDAPRLVTSEPISAVEKQGRVTVTFADARFMFDKRDGLYLGTVALTVTPGDDDQYPFVLHLPNRIEARERDKIVGVIAMERIAVAGTWLSDLEVFTDLDVALRGLRLDVGDAKDRVTVSTLGSLAATRKLNRGDGALWSGPFSAVVSDFHAQDERGRDQFDLAELRIEGRSEEVDLAGWARLWEFFGIDTGEGPQPLDAVEAKRFTTFLKDFSWGAVAFELAVTGVEARERDRTVFSLDGGRWTGAVDATRDLGALGLSFELDTLRVADGDIPQDLLPSRMFMDLAGEDVPLRMWLTDVLSEVALRGPQALNERTVFDEARFMDLVMKARSALVLRNFDYQCKAFSVDATGRLSVEPEAAFMVVGGMTASVRGLDRTIRLAKREGKTDRDFREAAAFLSQLREFARTLKTTGGGEALHELQFEILRQGEITVNGKHFGQQQQGGKSP